MQHIGYNFRHFNDCHIHLGNLSCVNRSLNTHEILDYKRTFSILHVLVFPTNDEPETSKLEEFLDRGIYGLHGLQWITEHTQPEDLSDNPKILGGKFHGSYSNHARPSLAVLEELHRKKKVLMMHTGRYKDGNRSSRTSYLHALEIASYYTDIKVIMAHMGGTDTNICLNALKDSAHYDNIYFDTSGITTPYIIEKAVEIVGSKRVMFGSDVPWCSWRGQYNTVIDARISEEDMRNIMEYSFKELLK
jgi:predicted TIM-barrel fold metal-dependent hydrolase